MGVTYGSDHKSLNCRYATGASFSDSDIDDGIVMILTGDALEGDDGWPRPPANKIPTRTGAAGDPFGVLFSFENPGTVGSRAPSGAGIAVVIYEGITKAKKTAAPARDDVGKYVAVDATTTTADPGAVTTSNTQSRGLVVGISGTDADDHLIVLWG